MSVLLSGDAGKTRASQPGSSQPNGVDKVCRQPGLGSGAVGSPPLGREGDGVLRARWKDNLEDTGAAKGLQARGLEPGWRARLWPGSCGRRHDLAPACWWNLDLQSSSLKRKSVRPTPFPEPPQRRNVGPQNQRQQRPLRSRTASPSTAPGRKSPCLRFLTRRRGAERDPGDSLGGNRTAQGPSLRPRAWG